MSIEEKLLGKKGYMFYVEFWEWFQEQHLAYDIELLNKYGDKYLSLTCHGIKHFDVIVLGCSVRKIITLLELVVLEWSSFLTFSLF